MKPLRSSLAFALAAGVTLTVPTGAAQYPLWEAGIGVAPVVLPVYRGADEARTYVLPVPFLIYRGEWLKADREGTRARLIDNEQVQVTIAAALSPPVDSGDYAPRAGMPDLKPTVEVGPSLEWKAWRAGDLKLYLRLPLRWGFTLESSPRSTGWVASPHINLDIENVGGSALTLGLLAGPIFASRRQHEYFYSVAPQFANATRPAYAARGGYSGAQGTVALWQRRGDWWMGGFVRLDTLRGASFEDSPLVQRRSAYIAGFAVSRILGKSSKLVDADE